MNKFFNRTGPNWNYFFFRVLDPNYPTKTQTDTRNAYAYLLVCHLKPISFTHKRAYHLTTAILLVRREPEPLQVSHLINPRDWQLGQGSFPSPLHSPHLWEKKRRFTVCKRNHQTESLRSWNETLHRVRSIFMSNQTSSITLRTLHHLILLVKPRLSISIARWTHYFSSSRATY